MRFLLILLVCVASGCGIETNRDRALRAQRLAEINTMLTAVEEYRQHEGHLPNSLRDLLAMPGIENIAISNYNYSPNSLSVAEDGTRWLIAISDPINPKNIIVGRTPRETAIKVRALGHP